jgi:peptide/nickel transport system substrate-binding protein
VRLRAKSTWDWMKSIEKLGSHKIRITTQSPAPWHLVRLSFETWIFPEHIFRPLADKEDYGRPAHPPVGTGEYKYTLFDRNSGARLTRNEAFRHGGDAKAIPTIQNFFFKHVPNIQTQVAGMLVGEWDILKDATLDQARDLAADPRFTLSVRSMMAMPFIALDANGLSGKTPLEDVRVRRAFFMAVNREELRRLFYGDANFAFQTDNLCFKFMNGCDYTANQFTYDPEGAKKLLSEAGYPNGLELEVSVSNTGPFQEMAKALYGQMRRVGINLKIDARAQPAFLKKEADKQTTIRMSMHSPRIPDINGTIEYFFEPGATRNQYFLDEKGGKLADLVNIEMDTAKRKQLMHQLLDYNASNAWVLPVGAAANVFVHTIDLKMDETGSYEAFGFWLRELSWK